MSLPLKVGPLRENSYRRLKRALEDVSGAWRYIPRDDQHYEDLPVFLDVKRISGGQYMITLKNISEFEMTERTLKLVSYLAYAMEVVQREQAHYSSALYSYLQFEENAGEGYVVAINVSGNGALRVTSIDNDGWRENTFFAYEGSPAPRADETEEVITDIDGLVPW